MLNLAPWYYKNLLVDNNLIGSPQYYDIHLLDGSHQFEANIFLKPHLKPAWLAQSEIYKNCDGSGTSPFQNIAVYKAISEALERLAFYELAESPQEKKFCFDINPTTTGMAAYPYWSTSPARKKAKTEGIERWAIHEFNRQHIPIIEHQESIKDLKHYELMTPFDDVKVSLLSYKTQDFFAYAFAGGETLQNSFDRALIELNRNLIVLTKVYKSIGQQGQFTSATDKTLYFFSTLEGYDHFQELIKKSPQKIMNINPKILCDTELIGQWTKFTRVWRFLLEDSYYDCNTNHKFFMF